MENFRRAIGLRIKETKEVYEGEVTELTPEETENPLGGYGKTVAHVIIGLKTTKGTKQLKLDPSIYEVRAPCPANKIRARPPLAFGATLADVDALPP